MFRQVLTEGSRKIDVSNKEHDQVLNNKLGISNQLIFSQTALRNNFKAQGV